MGVSKVTAEFLPGDLSRVRKGEKGAMVKDILETCNQVTEA